jgi:hypothetical protein
MEFVDGPGDKVGQPEWIECVIYRKDRSHPTKVREYMVECKRSTGPWQSHPRRMLRNKVIAQGGRVAFGFVGIYDPDEAERIVERDITPVLPTSTIASINASIAPPPASPVETPVTDAVVVEAVEAVEADEYVMSYANVATRIERAGDTDVLAEAIDMIRYVASKEQQGELRVLAEKRHAYITGPD